MDKGDSLGEAGEGQAIVMIGCLWYFDIRFKFEPLLSDILIYGIRLL